MAEVRPFRALRYDEAIAGPLSLQLCPPYDVISSAERRELEARSPFNFVRVELDRAAPADQIDQRYASAAGALRTWIAHGALRRDEVPSVYLHEDAFDLGGERLVRRGFFCALRLYPEAAGVVRPHERTLPKDRSDRLRLLRATKANTSPIFGLFDDASGSIATALREWIGSGAAREVARASVGTEAHTLWGMDDPAAVKTLDRLMADLRIYIADGHHRYETALEHHRESGGPGPGYVLADLCALHDPGLRILPTHRVLRGGRDALEAAVTRSFESAPIDEGAIRDTQPGIALVRDGSFRRVTLRDGVDLSGLPEAWRTLPVAQAENFLVEPARRAGALVEYDHDTDRAIAAASGDATAVLLRPVDPQTLRRIADMGERLPPKTTYFYPKVPAGLVIRTLEE